MQNGCASGKSAAIEMGMALGEDMVQVNAMHLWFWHFERVGHESAGAADGAAWSWKLAPGSIKEQCTWWLR